MVQQVFDAVGVVGGQGFGKRLDVVEMSMFALLEIGQQGNSEVGGGKTDAGEDAGAQRWELRPAAGGLRIEDIQRGLGVALGKTLA